MPSHNEQLSAAIDRLMQVDEEQLLREIGMRTLAMQAEPSAAGTFQPPATAELESMGGVDDLLRLGARVFRRLQVEAYAIVCGDDAESGQDREELLEAIGVDAAAAAKALAPLLVVQLGLAPAVAAVVAALIMKRFFGPLYQEFCNAWKKRLPAPG